MISIYNQVLSTAAYVASTCCRKRKRRPDISTSSIELSRLEPINASLRIPKTEENSEVWKRRYHDEGLATVYEILYERIGVHPLAQIIANYASVKKPKYPIDYEKVVLRGVTNLFGPNDYREYFGIQMNASISLKLWMKMRAENNQPHPTLDDTIGKTHKWIYIPPLKIQQIKSLETRSWSEFSIYEGTEIDIRESEICCDDKGYWILMPETSSEQKPPFSYEEVEESLKKKGYQIPSLKEILLAASACHARENQLPGYGDRIVYTIHTDQLDSNRYKVIFRARALHIHKYVKQAHFELWKVGHPQIDIFGVRKFDMDGLEITSHA